MDAPARGRGNTRTLLATVLERKEAVERNLGYAEPRGINPNDATAFVW